jgi:hypothetical protein
LRQGAELVSLPEYLLCGLLNGTLINCGGLCGAFILWGIVILIVLHVLLRCLRLVYLLVA